VVNPRNRAEDSSKAGYIPMTYIDGGYVNCFRFDIRKWGEVKTGLTHLADGDVAFAKITPCFQNRKSMVLSGLPNGIAGGTTELNVLRTYGDTICREYLLFFVKTHYFIGEASFKGTAGQQRVRTGYTENKLIPIPPISEQYRIVQKIIDVMPLTEKYEISKSNLNFLNLTINDQLRKSILQEAIQGRLVPQNMEDAPASELLRRIHDEKLRLVKEGKLKRKDIVDSVIFRGDDNKYFEKKGKEVVCIDGEIPFEIPSTWEWTRLDTICEYIQRGKSPKYSPIKRYPVVAQKCNQWNGFSIEKAQFIDPETLVNYDKGRMLQDKDLLWNSTGLGTLGRMSIYYTRLNPYELAVADSHVTVIRAIKEYIIPEYLYAYFASNTVQSVIEDKSDGSTKQKELATTTVRTYLVPLPPLEEQKRIVAKIEQVFPLIR